MSSGKVPAETDTFSPQNPFAKDLRSEDLDPNAPPRMGLPGLVYRLTRIKVSPTREEVALRKKAISSWSRQAQSWEKNNLDWERNDGYCINVTVCSEKGGVGKTTVSACLTYLYAQDRSAPVVAADANPDRGSLLSRFGVKSSRSIRDLIQDADEVKSSGDLSRYLARVPNHPISVLAGDTNPERRDKTSEDDILTISELFRSHFHVAVYDNGTGVSHSAMRGSLGVSQSIALVIDNTNDAFDFVQGTLDYLDRHDYEDLRKRVVLVICDKIIPVEMAQKAGPESWKESAKTTSRDIFRHFRDQVRDTVVIPYDPALAKAGPLVWEEIGPRTQRAFRNLAGVLADDFQ